MTEKLAISGARRIIQDPRSKPSQIMKALSILQQRDAKREAVDLGEVLPLEGLQRLMAKVNERQES
jgi:hypothetical protein